MITATNPRAVREVALHFRARRLCASAEPHTSAAPCGRHVEEARRSMVDVARERQDGP